MDNKLTDKTLFGRILQSIDSSSRSLLRPVITIALPISLAAGQVSAVDLGIENDAEYTQLVNAMRAAEYVRSDIIVAETPKPRVYAVLAAVMAFAEQNPNSTDEQIEAFLYAFDAACQAFTENDPDLNDRANLYAALRFAIVEDAILSGTNTQIGQRALEMIGVTIPNPDGYLAIQSRMVEFEISLGRSLDYRNEVYDLLVHGFYGQDTGGVERPGLPSILNDYFESEGFDPELGGIRADLPQIDSGLASLPSNYLEYEQAIRMGAANQSLRDMVNTQLDSVRDRITMIVGVDENIDDGLLDDAIRNDPGLIESLDSTINDPMYVESVLNTLRSELESTAEARAASYSAMFLMLQSDDGTITDYASFNRDYSQIALETNEQMADLKAGISLVSTAAIAAGGVYFNQPEIAVGAFASLGSQVLDLATSQDAAPSVDEQTFQQLVELRQQVEQMRQEMNFRFDRIDEQLNFMTDAIGLGFDGIGDQIGDVQDDTSLLILNMAAARSELRRLESALYLLVQDDLLLDLTVQTNLALDYRNDFTSDFPYIGQGTNFSTAATYFYTYASTTSKSAAFSGSRSNPIVTLANVDGLIQNNSLTQFINDLAVLPQELGLGGLAPTTLVGIEPWSQAASAYTQLARENPWYFGFRNGGGGADELAQIIQDGERLNGFVEAIREVDSEGNSELFDALIQNYRDALTSFQDQVDASVLDYLPADFLASNGTLGLDLWAQSPQYLVDMVGPLQVFEPEGDGYAAQPLYIPYQSVPFEGWGTFANPGNIDQVSLLQTMFIIEEAKSPTPNDVRVVAGHRFYGGPFEDNEYSLHIEIEGLRPNSNGDSRVWRRMDYEAELGLDLLGTLTWFAFDVNTLLEVEEFFEYLWDRTGLNFVLPDNRGSTYSDPNWYAYIDDEPFSTSRRLRNISGANSPVINQSEILPDLYGYRVGLRNNLLTDLLNNPGSDLSLAADELDRAVAILNAYVSIGMPNELNQSQLLRSALRAVPGESEVGLGSFDVIALISKMAQNDSNPESWGDDVFNVNNIEGILSERVDIVAAEIQRGLQSPAITPGYVGWVLAELYNLQATATSFAIDDTYITQGPGLLTITGENGLLTNDLDQPEILISVDLEFSSHPEYIAPLNGTVSVNADGSFTYQPDTGFVGVDTFSYRTTAMIPNTLIPVLSDPASVVVVVEDAECGPADLTDDGVLNFLDVSAFLGAFGESDPVADFTNDGILNFLDVSAFLSAFSTSCP
jgi:Bacterial Ig domain